ncbi:S1/P1 nuclease [Mucilaginibacter gossypii]|uniref:S1/P1 Nuclease n=1 Tax=Mucilaginibacter gossypii TaxID=551996 RepID=A0A1G8A711_9SPHI|nr:S1/P1 nuclease [Mucilaginibacter gossypii]SDH16734.1 S1/P1 Nuclease [Mucilaginibacter gossypii]
MRKQVLSITLIAISAALISWGYKGHRAVATIAQKHLTSNTAYAVSAYLKGESMADVSTWADEHRNPTTGKWHFLNLPLGLSHQQFVDFVNQQSNDNVYGAILKEEAILKDQASTPDQKNSALKYLIHLVGDAHQPMHISRAEDKGGNTIQLRFDNAGTNLHSLWDSKLIDHEGLSEEQIAKQYDWANDAQIKKWQAASPMEWLWESYQISSELYADIKSGQHIDEAYYKKYMPTVHLRIDQAGIRLAGELNKLFNDTKVEAIKAEPINAPALSNNAAPAQQIKLEDVKNNVGKAVSVTGKVFSSKDIRSMVLVNLGAPYPKQLLTVVLKGDARQLTTQLENRTITVQGKIIEYQGKPEIVVEDTHALSIEN